jgi:hypothetical protein
MGGNGALKFALKFPDLFSSVVAYAGSYELLPKDGFLYPGVAPEFRVWLQTLAKCYIADNDPFELAKFNRYRLNGLRIRLVAGTMDVALKDSEALHKYFQDIGIVHEYSLYLGIAHDQAAYYKRGASKASASTCRLWNRQGNEAFAIRDTPRRPKARMLSWRAPEILSRNRLWLRSVLELAT